MQACMTDDDDNLLSKSIDWFLYDRDHRHDRIKNNFIEVC